jgi:tellurite resistance protein
MFSALSKAVGKVRDKIEALVNEEELKAVVSAAVLVAAADGSISEKEQETAFAAISDHDSLRGFSQATIRKYFESDVKLINSDRMLAEKVLYSQVASIKEIKARIRVIGVANQIANADGELSESEKKVIDKIRQITG